MISYEKNERGSEKMVYLLENTGLLPIEAMLPLVSAARREKALAYCHEADQRNCLAVWLLLRYGLDREYHLAQVPPLCCGPGGKPAFAGGTEAHFSLSHSGAAAICALSREEVGADIECWTACRPAVLRRAFAPAECRAVKEASDPATVFTAIWTRKEAYGKALGVGVAYEMEDVDLSQPGPLADWHLTTWQRETCCLSLCAREKLPLQVLSAEALLDFFKV